MANPIPQYRKIVSSRVETTTDGLRVCIDTLECGHEVIHTPFASEIRCVACHDEAKYGKPAPTEPTR